MLKPEVVIKEMQALQKHFKSKRDFVISRLRAIGFKFNRIPNRSDMSFRESYTAEN